MEYVKLITGNEEEWCKKMGYRNPYLDPYSHHITSTAVPGDHTAYRKFPENRHVYDKLWIAQTQKMRCGRLEDLKGKETNVKYPIFIKPRWGHLSASSKNCFKIKDSSSLNQYIDYPDMMWSEFVDGTEGMTDFLLLNGRIVGYNFNAISKLSKRGNYIHIATLPEYRQQGIATSLTSKAFEWFRYQGARSVLLSTFADSQFHNDMYKRWGFTFVDQEIILTKEFLDFKNNSYK